jgi:hypothetical protein
MNSKKIASIIKDIKQYFDFMFDKGYKIRSAEYSSRYNGSWVVKLESSDCIIYITSDRDLLILEFSSLNNQNTKNRINIDKMLYLLNRGENNIGPFSGNLAWGKKSQFIRLSNLLKEHIDQIETYFRSGL